MSDESSLGSPGIKSPDLKTKSTAGQMPWWAEEDNEEEEHKREATRLSWIKPKVSKPEVKQQEPKAADDVSCLFVVLLSVQREESTKHLVVMFRHCAHHVTSFDLFRLPLTMFIHQASPLLKGPLKPFLLGVILITQLFLSARTVLKKVNSLFLLLIYFIFDLREGKFQNIVAVVKL